MPPQRAARSLVAAVGVLALAACGSDPGGTAPQININTVAGGGHEYRFGGDVPRSGWPNPCSFIPVRSASVLLGGTARANRGALVCSYGTSEAGQLGLVVQVRWIGAAASDKFQDALRQLSRPRFGVNGVGSGAARARVAGGQTTLIDALVGNVYFRIQVRSPTRKPVDLSEADRIATRAAQLVAAQLR